VAGLRALAFMLLAWLPGPALAQTYLLMAEEAGCQYCALWNAQIAPIYPKTPEGQTAPLQRFDLHGEHPAVAFQSKLRFSPTFILVQDGREVGRIEGYPGEDFFWGLLGMMFQRAKIPLEPTG
jgi:hypothetical protein